MYGRVQAYRGLKVWKAECDQLN